jgi:23S rRNA pseudouridine1911/1915/1917 synthase
VSEDPEIIIVDQEEAGIRLDRVLAARYIERQSRTYFQNLIDAELVLLNGLPVKKRVKPQAGDEVEVQFALSPDVDLTPEPIPLDVLFEDDHLLVVNKPVGMVVHPAPGNWSGTFVNALLHHCCGAEISSVQDLKSDLRPGIVHRLDKETSGVLVAAKTLFAQQRLVSMFAMRQVEKEYLAICVGNPGKMAMEWPIGRHPVHRKKMAVVEKGKPARTFCSPLGMHGQLALVSIQIETGRTHQIRVHMQHRGTPVLGDGVYGNVQANKQFGAMRQMLHARRLSFLHPIYGKLLCIEAPLPMDMADMCARFDISAI